MRLYWKYSKATICRHMKKNTGDLVVAKEKPGKTTNAVFFGKREITYDQPSACEKRCETFMQKRVMVKAVIPLSISKETARSQSNQNDKTCIFDRFFLITNYCVKIVTNTNKKICWGHID